MVVHEVKRDNSTYIMFSYRDGDKVRTYTAERKSWPRPIRTSKRPYGNDTRYVLRKYKKL